jgi:hypothetical protein
MGSKWPVESEPLPEAHVLVPAETPHEPQSFRIGFSIRAQDRIGHMELDNATEHDMPCDRALPHGDDPIQFALE